jgi:stress-induced-phosphoprotein 1
MDGLRSVLGKANTGETDDGRAAHGLADPEIQAIVRAPVAQSELNAFQTDTVAAQRRLPMDALVKLLHVSIGETFS